MHSLLWSAGTGVSGTSGGASVCPAGSSYHTGYTGACTVLSTNWGFVIPVLIVALAVWILFIIGWWKIFTKAGKPGWGAIIPIYNIYLMCKVAQRPGWWTILFFIPIVNVIMLLLVMIEIAKHFGKTAGFAVGFWILAFFGIGSWLFGLILGFGSATYQGGDAPAAPAPSVTA